MGAPNTTPGPWRVVDVSVKPTAGDDGVRFYDIRAGEVVLSPYSPMLTGHIDCGGIGVAQVMKRSLGPQDAHLIAASPELYEALEGLERYLRDTPHHNAPEAAAARSALRKARGEA